MPLSASAPTSGNTTTGEPPHRLRRFGPAAWLLAAFIALASLLAAVPDGMAAPLQAVIGWLLVGIAAAAAVIAIAEGLERLLDWDGS